MRTSICEWMNLNNKINVTLPHSSVLWFLCYCLLWFSHSLIQYDRTIKAYSSTAGCCDQHELFRSSWSLSSCTLALSSVLLDRFWSPIETPANVSLFCICMLVSFFLSSSFMVAEASLELEEGDKVWKHEAVGSWSCQLQNKPFSGRGFEHCADSWVLLLYL